MYKELLHIIKGHINSLNMPCYQTHAIQLEVGHDHQHIHFYINATCNGM